MELLPRRAGAELTIRSPISVCPRTRSPHSSSFNADGLLMMESGMAILPMSCKAAPSPSWLSPSPPMSS